MVLAQSDIIRFQAVDSRNGSPILLTSLGSGVTCDRIFFPSTSDDNSIRGNSVVIDEVLTQCLRALLRELLVIRLSPRIVRVSFDLKLGKGIIPQFLCGNGKLLFGRLSYSQI